MRWNQQQPHSKSSTVRRKAAECVNLIPEKSTILCRPVGPTRLQWTDCTVHDVVGDQCALFALYALCALVHLCTVCTVCTVCIVCTVCTICIVCIMCTVCTLILICALFIQYKIGAWDLYSVVTRYVQYRTTAICTGLLFVRCSVWLKTPSLSERSVPLLCFTKL